MRGTMTDDVLTDGGNTGGPDHHRHQTLFPLLLDPHLSSMTWSQLCHLSKPPATPNPVLQFRAQPHGLSSAWLWVVPQPLCPVSLSINGGDTSTSPIQVEVPQVV
jgi:hypothetical protein